MRKTNLIFIVLLVIVMAFGLFACDKGGSEPAPTISVSGLTGSGTEADPYGASVVNGSQVKFAPAISKEGLEAEVSVISGADCADVVLANGEVTVTGKKVGYAIVKANIKGSETAVYVKVTVTAKPASGITFAELETGAGTLASPYVASVRAGFTASTPYLVTPSDADDKAVTWTVGTITSGAFAAATDRGITAAANAANNVLTVTAAESATIGDTVVKATAGSATAYIKFAVSAESKLSSWNNDAFADDWFTANCNYNKDNADDFEMPAASYIYNKLTITADTSALVIRAKKAGSDSAIAKVSVGDTVLTSLLGGQTCFLTADKTTNPAYDLTSYVGQTVTVKIENTGAGAMALSTAELYKMDTTATERTTWEKAEIISDWTITTASAYRAGTGEGFDLNTNDDDGYQYIYNKLAVTASTSRIAFKVRRFGQDNGVVACALAYANGNLVNPIGHDGCNGYVLDTDGKSSYLVYDLSEYVDQTVCFVFALANKNVGHLVIQEIKLDTMDKTVSSLTSWGKESIATDWDITYASGYRTGTGEGFDLNTADGHANEFIYNYKTVSADNAKLVVKVRRFGQDNGIANKCLLFVDGDLLVPMGYTSGDVTIADVDTSATQLVYDLTEYIGETVQIVVMQPVPFTGHLVIMSIEMSAWEAKTASALDSWTKDTFVSDWTITYAAAYRSGTGEGFDFNTNDGDANEFIYNYVTVTAAKSDFVVKVRRFGQDNGVANACGVLVNGELLIAADQTEGYAPIADTDGDVTTLRYDLSEYIGETVQIVIIQPVPKAGHLVLMSAEFAIPAPAVG